MILCCALSCYVRPSNRVHFIFFFHPHMALLAEAEKLRLELSLGPPGTPLIEIADAACEQLGFAGELGGQPVTRKIAACLERMGSGKEEPPPPPAALLMGEAVSDEAVLVGLPASAAVETSSGAGLGLAWPLAFRRHRSLNWRAPWHPCRSGWRGPTRAAAAPTGTMLQSSRAVRSD